MMIGPSDSGQVDPAYRGAKAGMLEKLGGLGFLGKEERAVLASYLDYRRLAEGEVLWEEKQPSRYLALLLAGRLEIKKDTEFPGKQVVVGVYGPGAVVGELSFFDGTPRAVTVVALEQAELATLSRERFSSLEAQHPDVAAALSRGVLLALASRLKQAYERLAAIF